MNMLRNRFLYWVVYFPLAINIILYISGLIARTISWYYAEPDSKFSSTGRILDGGYTFDEFLRERLLALAVAVIIGLGVWFWEYHSAKKDLESKPKKP